MLKHGECKALHTEILLTCPVGTVVGVAEEGLACHHCWPLHQKGTSAVNFTVPPAKEGDEQLCVKGWEDVGIGEQKVPFSSKDVFLNLSEQ